MKKRRSPALWLLMIPAQLVLGALFSFLGMRIDIAIFSGGGQGHGAPIFSVLFPIIAVILTVVVIILSLILMAVGFSRRSREQREAALAAAQRQNAAYPQQPYPQPYPPQQYPPQQSPPPQ
jgi:hypothetical protein